MYETNLTNLTGTEKQIAWAQKISQEKIEVVSQQFGRNFPGKLETAIFQLKSINNAKFWIENKDCGGLILGMYGFSLSGEKLGLNGKNFIDTWVYQEKIKNSGDKDWTIKKECDVDDLCLAIKFPKSPASAHTIALNKWWYKLDVNQKTLEILQKQPEEQIQDEVIFNSFRSFLDNAGKLSGWNSRPIRMLLLKVGISQEIKMRYAVDFVVE